MQTRGQISYERARRIAEDSALEELRPFIRETQISVIRDYYIEDEYCWFFFRNPLIEGPPERVLRWDRAYAVSKKGELRMIPDYSKDSARLTEYLHIMSNYFKEHGI